MFFEYDITVPAQTAEASALRQDLDLKWGTVRRIAVQFPRGCYGLVHAQIWSGRHQIAPVNELGNIKAEDDVVEFDTEWDLMEPPYLVTAVVWNDDDSYDHTLTIRIEVDAKLATPWTADMFFPQSVPIPATLQ